MASKKDFKVEEVESLLSEILDPQDLEVYAVRGKGCEIVFSNAKAKERLYNVISSDVSCKTSYGKMFPRLCDFCPNGGKNTHAVGEAFEVRDFKDRIYTARCNTVTWADGKQATTHFLRDITQEIKSKERLHTLAYIDQQTGIPNRQRLKDDFSVLLESISNNQVTGILTIIDLDNFKMVNDTYGHNTGDLVLRCLTEYFEEHELFSGHLYRLGGDEFVLLYVDAADRFDSEDELKQHYRELLSNALRSYTLPNIEVVCTLSVGVSIFPKHGKNLSEVLRKADIALYKAKAGGRNQIVFFESHYDTAQKFKDLYISFQPILLRSGVTFGYDLVDRGNSGKEDENAVKLGQFNRTVDALGLTDIENRIQYFIMYSRQLLNPTVLRNLPKDKFVVQVMIRNLDNGEVLQNYVQSCLLLRENGYRIALAGLRSDTDAGELMRFAEYCKLSVTEGNLDRQKKFIAANKKVKFIATDVDTREAFINAQSAGFNLFQGFYFRQPEIGQKTKEINPLRANYFRLLKLTGTDGYMDFQEITSVISSDVALSYKLLRILNSAAVGLKNVSSVAIAVAYLGEETLKKWIAVLALRGIAEDKPLELVRMSLVRARFGELLAPQFSVKMDVKKVFVVGLLSLLHIALDIPKEQLLEEISVADDIKESLLTDNGVYSELLRFYENYEYANWDDVSQFVEENNLDSREVNDTYITAVRWYNDLVESA